MEVVIFRFYRFCYVNECTKLMRTNRYNGLTGLVRHYIPITCRLLQNGIILFMPELNVKLI